MNKETKDQLEELVKKIKGEIIYQDYRDSYGRTGNVIRITYNTKEDHANSI